MNNWNDIQTAVKNEITHWFGLQCRDPFSDFYLYYLPSTPEHDGGFIICKDQPANPDYILATPNRMNKGATIEQNLGMLEPILQKLPVLSIRKTA
jgi:hypothetical protein